MKRAFRKLAPDESAEGTALTLTMAYDARHRRRHVVEAGGETVLIDLEKAERLRSGDRLALEGGGHVAIEAEAEPVADLHVADPLALAKLAWHLGNRHTPTAIFENRVRIRPDHVLEALAESHGARVERLAAPFDPEAGAYHSAGHGHHHHHADDD